MVVIPLGERADPVATIHTDKVPSRDGPYLAPLSSVVGIANDQKCVHEWCCKSKGTSKPTFAALGATLAM